MFKTISALTITLILWYLTAFLYQLQGDVAWFVPATIVVTTLGTIISLFVFIIFLFTTLEKIF